MLTLKHNQQQNSLLQGFNRKQKSAILILSIFLLNFAIYGVNCFQFSLCGDEIRELMEGIPDIYIAQNRWGTVLWKELFGYGYMPFLSFLIFAVTSSLIAYLHTELFNIQNFSNKLIYAVAFTLCPLWLSINRFSELIDIFSISMLLATMAVSNITSAKSPSQYIIAIILATLSLAVYQVNLFYMATLWLAWYTSSLFHCQHRNFLREAIRAFVIILISIIIYVTIAIILRNSGLASPKIIAEAASYQGNFATTWKTVLQSKSIIYILRVFGHYTIETVLCHSGIKSLIGASSTYTHIYLWAGNLCCVWLMIQTWRKYTAKNSAILNILTYSVLFISFSAYLFSAGKMNEFRMHIPCSISIAFMFTMLAEINKNKPSVIRLIHIILLLTMIKGAYSHTETLRNNAWNFERTKLQFIEIKHHCKDIAKQNGLKEYKVYLAGDWWPIKSISLYNALEVAEAPFLTGIVQPFAVKNYAAYFGCGNIERMENIDTPEEIKHILQTKPVWPDPDSVFIYNGDIIIKVYENPPPRNQKV